MYGKGLAMIFIFFFSNAFQSLWGHGRNLYVKFRTFGGSGARVMTILVSHAGLHVPNNRFGFQCFPFGVHGRGVGGAGGEADHSRPHALRFQS